MINKICRTNTRQSWRRGERITLPCRYISKSTIVLPILIPFWIDTLKVIVLFLNIILSSLIINKTLSWHCFITCTHKYFTLLTLKLIIFSTMLHLCTFCLEQHTLYVLHCNLQSKLLNLLVPSISGSAANQDYGAAIAALWLSMIFIMWRQFV